MRISKNSARKSTKTVSSKPVKASRTANEYAKAQNYIKCAIDALGASAKNNDSKARESIANLSVVLFDLQK